MGLIFPGGPKRLHKQGDVQGLLAILRDTSQPGKDRRYAAFALGDIGSPDAVEDLIAVLFDFEVRGLAAEALGAMGDYRAVGPLLVYAESNNQVVAKSFGKAVETLFELEHRSVRPSRESLRSLHDGRLRALCREM